MSKYQTAFALAFFILGSTLLCQPAWAQGPEEVTNYSISIAEQPLGAALNDLSRQTNTVIIVDASLVEGKRALLVSGSMSVDDAVNQMLRNSGLQARRLQSGTILVSNSEDTVESFGRNDDSTSNAIVDNVKADESAMNEVIITAIRSNKPASAIPQTITLIQQADLRTQLQLAPNLSGVLEKLVPSYGPNRQKLTSGGESFRGRKALILVDGIPQSNPLRDGGRSGFTIDPEAIERIEVIHGSNAVLGLGATGGIVNYVTKSVNPDGDLHQSASIKSSTSSQFEGNGVGYRAYYSVGQKRDQLDFMVSGAFEHRPIQYDGQGKAIGVETTSGDTADSDTVNLFAKFGYDFGGNQRVELMLNKFKIKQSGEWISSGGNLELGEPSIAIRGEIRGDAPENDVMMGALSYTNQDIWNGSLSITGYYQDFDAVFGGGTFGSFQDPALAPIGTLLDQTKISSDKKGLRTTYVQADVLDTGIDVTTGFDYIEDETLQALIQTGRNRVPLIKYKGLAPFVQLDMRFFDRLAFSTGARYENADLDIPDFSTNAGATRRLPSTDPRYYTRTAVAGGSPSFSELIYNIGAIFDINDSFSIFSSFSQGFTIPDVGRAIRDLNTPGIEIDRFLDIEPVLVDSTELGFSFGDEQWDLRVNYYWSESDLGARLVANLDDQGSVRTQRQRVEIEGLEFVADFAVTDRFNIGTIYSSASGKSDTDSDGRVDTKLDALNISPDKFLAYINAALLDNINIRLQALHYFDEDFDDSNTRGDFTGYTLVDLNILYHSNFGDFNLAIENILDETYLSLFSQSFAPDTRQFRGRGRTLSVGYTINF